MKSTPWRRSARAASQRVAAFILSGSLQMGTTGLSSNPDPSLLTASRKVRLMHPARTLYSTAMRVLAPAESCARSLRVQTDGTRCAHRARVPMARPVPFDEADLAEDGDDDIPAQRLEGIRGLLHPPAVAVHRALQC